MATKRTVRQQSKRTKRSNEKPLPDGEIERAAMRAGINPANLRPKIREAARQAVGRTAREQGALLVGGAVAELERDAEASPALRREFIEGMIERLSQASEDNAPGIEYVRLERDGVERTVEDLRDAVGDTLDALADIGAEGHGALNITHALVKLRSAWLWLETETSNPAAGGVS